MNKDAIIDALVEIGDAIVSSRYRDSTRKAKEENRKNRRDVGYAVGTVLYYFDYDDGIQEVTVVGQQQINDGSQVRYATAHDVLSDTVDGAIRAAVESWIESQAFDFDECVSHFEFDVKYHGERCEWARAVLAAIMHHRS